MFLFEVYQSPIICGRLEQSIDHNHVVDGIRQWKLRHILADNHVVEVIQHAFVVVFGAEIDALAFLTCRAQPSPGTLTMWIEGIFDVNRARRPNNTQELGGFSIE